MRKSLVFILACLLFCIMAGDMFAKGKDKKGSVAMPTDPASMQSVEVTVTGILATSDEKKFGFTVADDKGKIIAYLPKPKKLTVDVSPYVGMKVKVVGMAMGGKKDSGGTKFDAVKSVDKVEEKPAAAGATAPKK